MELGRDPPIRTKWGLLKIGVLRAVVWSMTLPGRRSFTFPSPGWTVILHAVRTQRPCINRWDYHHAHLFLRSGCTFIAASEGHADINFVTTWLYIVETDVRTHGGRLASDKVVPGGSCSCANNGRGDVCVDWWIVLLTSKI